MTKASGSLQDLRSGLYGKRKAERPWHRAEASGGSGGVVDGESGTDQIGPINLVAKCAGARSEGNPHAAYEVAGAGNGATDTARRARRGKPRIQPSQRPDGPPRQFPTLHPLSSLISELAPGPNCPYRMTLSHSIRAWRRCFPLRHQTHPPRDLVLTPSEHFLIEG